MKRELKGSDDKPFLLVFDGAVRSVALAPFLPLSSTVRVLVTSNSTDWTRQAKVVPVETWDDDLSAGFLIHRTGRSDGHEKAKQLSRELGGLAVALEAAASCCVARSIGPREYRELLKSVGVELLEKHIGGTGYRGFAQTLSLLLARATTVNSGAKDLLQHIVCLAEPLVPLSLFQTEDGAPRVGLPEAFRGDGLEDAIGTLNGEASLIVRRQQPLKARLQASSTDSLRTYRAPWADMPKRFRISGAR